MKRLLLALSLVAASLPAQQLSSLPRATALEVNDSTLTLVQIASPFRTRALTLGILKSVLVPAFADSATGAARAQILTTARTINGTSFNGSANITVTAAAGTLTGATLNSGVTASSLTTFGVGALTDSAVGAARAQILTTARTLWGQSFNGSANVTAAPTFGAGATISSGQNLVMTGAAITGSPTATLGAITVSSCTGCGGGTTFPLAAPNEASRTVPSYSWSGATKTGFFRQGTTGDTLGLAAGDSAMLKFYFNGSQNRAVISHQASGTGLRMGATPGSSTYNVAFFANNVDVAEFRARSGSAPLFQLNGTTTDCNGGWNFGFPTVSSQTGWGAGGGNNFLFCTGNDTLFSIAGNGGSGAVTLTGNSGSMVIRPATANNATLTLQSNAGATAKNTLVLGADSSATFLGPINMLAANNALPPLRFNGTTTGLAYNGASCQSLMLVSNGNAQVTLCTSMKFNVNLQAGDGTAALPAYSFQSDSSSGIRYSGTAAGGDTVTIVTGGTDRVRFATNAATGAGDVNLCVTTTGVTKVVTQGATCGSSSSKVKTNIATLVPSTPRLMALRATSYTYQKGFYGERAEFGLIADEVSKVDRRLAFYADHDDKLPNGQTIKKGEAFNVNDRAVLALLLAEVQQLRRQVDSLRAIKK